MNYVADTVVSYRINNILTDRPQKRSITWHKQTLTRFHFWFFVTIYWYLIRNHKITIFSYQISWTCSKHVICSFFYRKSSKLKMWFFFIPRNLTNVVRKEFFFTKFPHFLWGKRLINKQLLMFFKSFCDFFPSETEITKKSF